jgi:regulator of protease activity HflC (stomatin/prohibitin superfamily)
MESSTVIWTILAILALILIISCFRIVPQAKAYVVERLGAYHVTWNAGMIKFKIPFIDRVAKIVSLKEQVVDFPPQPVITKDNVTMQIDTIVFFQVTDPKLYTYGVERPVQAIENLTATTLRNIIGELELDHTLTSRDVINTKIREILDEASDPWGIKVNRVELKNIVPPREIQDAMEKQMKAERERRQAVLRAEGEKSSQILVSEGQKASQILQAEAQKQSAILHAEGIKEAKIREAEGEAEAIMKVQSALAESIKLLNAASPSDKVIALKSLDALAKVADGKATKIVIPSEIQSLASLAVSLKEFVAADSDEPAPAVKAPVTASSAPYIPAPVSAPKTDVVSAVASAMAKRDNQNK